MGGRAVTPRYYPIFLDLEGRPVIVIGGGRVATEKVAGLRRAGARITVVSPDLAPELQELRARGEIAHIPRAWREEDLDGDWAVVMVATDDGAVNRGVRAAARARRLWVNAADDPANCDFILPAVVRRGRITLAASTGGASPALARRLREELEAYLTEDMPALADLLAEVRAEVRARGLDVPADAWQAAIDEHLRVLLAQRKHEQARAYLRRRLGVDLSPRLPPRSGDGEPAPPAGAPAPPARPRTEAHTQSGGAGGAAAAAPGRVGGRDASARLFARARELLPGGVDSPVRAFRAVGGEPLFIERGRGARVWDADGNEYVDWVGSWGPLILGHADPRVVTAVSEAVAAGTSFGAPNRREVELAALIRDAMPAVAMVRLVSSGTEAAMSALRLARAATGREKVIKFRGCYHGHADGLLVEAGSGALTLGIPATPGVTRGAAADTLVAEFNDPDSVERLLDANPGAVAAVIVEPVAGNMGVVPPAPGFLARLRALADAHGALLVFDEVITGFRVGPGGAQGRYGVTPDLTVLGKVIGGGMPVGAYGGRRDLMELVAPSGPVYQAGTLSGNPAAMAAGIATLRALAAPGVYERLEATAAALADGLADAARSAGVPLTLNRVGSMFTPFFTAGPVDGYRAAMGADTARYAAFFRALLDAGVYPPPSQFEAWFVSTAHGEAEVEATIAAARRALTERTTDGTRGEA
jgi:glutamate-1-semialdehyde 2,1-aminomutase